MKQILIEKYSYFYPHNEYTNPLLLSGLIHRYTTYNDYNKVAIGYSQKHCCQCYYFLKVAEEMDEEYELRIKFEQKLEKLDKKVSDLIEKISTQYVTSEDYTKEEYIKDCKSYKRLVNKYSFLLMEMASCYDKVFDIWDSKKGIMQSRKQQLEIRAFAYPKETAQKMIEQWNKTHKSRESCPVTYQDTLRIPFQKIDNDSNEID